VQISHPPNREAHGSGTGQLVEPNVQRSPHDATAQLPTLGPVAVPETQVPRLGHQPQPGVALHPSHPDGRFARHGSTGCAGGGHFEGVQAQPLHEPEARPLAVPVAQWPMPHQPQDSFVVQLSQVFSVLHAP
jgi:hypothetical protein